MPVTLLKPRRRYLHATHCWREEQNIECLELRGHVVWVIYTDGTPDSPTGITPKEAEKYVASGSWLMYWSDPLPVVKVAGNGG